MESIQNLIREAAADTDIDVRSYSGRGMYGRNCMAIVGEHSEMCVLIATVIQNAHTEAFEAALHAENENEKDAACDLSGDVNEVISKIMDYRTDSMGLSTVLYWPNMEWVDEPMSFDEWKEGIAEMMDISVAELIKRSENIQDLKDAFDNGYTIEEAVEEYSK